MKTHLVEELFFLDHSIELDEQALTREKGRRDKLENIARATSENINDAECSIAYIESRIADKEHRKEKLQTRIGALA